MHYLSSMGFIFPCHRDVNRICCSWIPIDIEQFGCSLHENPFEILFRWVRYWCLEFCQAIMKSHSYVEVVINSSWPNATYMRRDFQCLFPQRPRYGALISVLISPVPHTWGVTNGSLLASPPNSRRSPASLISPATHICGASRTPILTLSCGKY